jgi:hypothetical protein
MLLTRLNGRFFSVNGAASGVLQPAAGAKGTVASLAQASFPAAPAAPASSPLLLGGDETTVHAQAHAHTRLRKRGERGESARRGTKQLEWLRFADSSLFCDVRLPVFLFQLREEFGVLSAELRELDPESPCKEQKQHSAARASPCR